MTEHKYAEILRAIADGKQLQAAHSVWRNIDSSNVLYQLSRDILTHTLRIKPEPILIGDMEVPKPEDAPPTMGEVYYVPYIDNHDLGYLFDSHKWDNDAVDNAFLSRRLVHLTKDAAITHAKALIKLSGGVV